MDVMKISMVYIRGRGCRHLDHTPYLLRFKHYLCMAVINEENYMLILMYMLIYKYTFKYIFRYVQICVDALELPVSFSDFTLQLVLFTIDF